VDTNPAERREFYRIAYEKPVRFREVAKGGVSGVSKAVSKNVSQSGILFISRSFPGISSIIWINLPMKELSICKEIESRALTVKNGILGRVVRVEEVPEGKSYSIGVCFVKKDDDSVKSLVEDIENSLKSGK
jgi:hypothetical protein